MKLENALYEVTFTLKGAEIQRFTDKRTGIQYMWQGDEKFWTGKNPTLFPIVGNTYTKDYEINGKRYAMKNHGIIRISTFTCIEQSDHRIVFELCDNEETRAVYPFSFRFHTIYELSDWGLTISYEITNTGETDMPFSFGLHPGFNCPLMEGESFEDYRLVFDHEEHLDHWIMDETAKKGVRIKPITVKEIPLRYAEIEAYETLMYTGMKSNTVTLQGKEHGVRVGIAGYPMLAFWTCKPGAPYLCIEPWYGYGDFYATEKDFYHRDGTMILSPQKLFTTSYTIEVF